jgi:hypothetical protein
MALSKSDILWRKRLGVERAKVSYLIKHEMRQRGFTARELARWLQCRDSNVSRVLLGKGHSPLVLNGLRSIGVPEHLLFDPHRIQANA